MRIFKIRAFERFARKNRIPDAALIAAVDEIRSGLVDADLGGGLFKHRIARPGRGKSAGFRVILALSPDSDSFFLLGYAKNDRANIEDFELVALRMLAGELLARSPEAIDEALGDGTIFEVKSDENGEEQNSN